MLWDWFSREYPIGGGLDMRDDDFPIVQFVEVLDAVAGAYVNSPCARIFCKLHVVGMIADHIGLAKIDPMFFGRFMQKERLRLHAGAALFAGMGTNIDGRKGQTGIGQQGNQMRIDSLDVAEFNQAFGDAGLIGNDEKEKIVFEPPQGGNGILKDSGLGHIGQMPPVLDERSIAVEKDCRSKLGGEVHSCYAGVKSTLGRNDS